jgi:peptidoglycan/LPS O-acetylase OafA/YrhL
MSDGTGRPERWLESARNGPDLLSPASTVAVDDRFMASGDEAGSSPGDRKFRPDVQGLRAVAILLVVLFHADIPGLQGGYVGVDVFFVISGFVITGVLLRERAATRRTSLLAFYGRRARRILPAASVVLVVTVVVSYWLLGPNIGRSTAVDGQWAAGFLANVHFALTSTNYLASQQPPSALQNYWSLAVEEQFYIVYPTVFLVVASLFTRRSLRSRIGIVLGAVIVASFAFSVSLTSSNAANAFFSPLTRAWELALGGLIAVSGEYLKRLPRSVAEAMSWLGLGGIVFATCAFTSASAYPGSLVAVPVIGAGLIIAAGAAQPTWGAESLLRLRPFQWLGLISYSLYLWHWPILIIATQRRGSAQLPVMDNILLLLFALVLAIGTYVVLENPVRHARSLMTRPWASVAMGGCLIAASFGVATAEVQRTQQGTSTNISAAAPGAVCHPQYRNEQMALRSAMQAGNFPADIRPMVHPLQMVVVGDSTACTLVGGLAAVGGVYGVHVADGTVIGCGIVSGQAPPYYYGSVNLERPTRYCQSEADHAEASAIARGKPDLIVWGSTEERSSVLVAGAGGDKVLAKGTREWRAVMLKRMNARVEQFLATGAKVVLLLQPPFVNSGYPTQPTQSDRDFERLNGLLREVAAAHPGRVATVDLNSRVCPSGPPCPYVVDGIGEGQGFGNGVRADGQHYGLMGSLWVGEWVLPKILATATGHS